jgi:AraC-like DNA-binding protein
MDLQILKTLSLFAIFQSVIWIVYLFYYDKGNIIQRRLLISLFITFVVYILGSLCLVFGSGQFLYNLATLSNLTIFVILPLFYIYVDSVLNKNETKSKTGFLHFVPFVVLLLISIYLIVFTKIDISENNVYFVVLISLFYVQCVAYVVIISKKIIPQSISLKAFIKAKNKSMVSWASPFLYGFSILILLKICIFIAWNMLHLARFCIVFTSLFLIISFIIINFLILVSLLKKEYILSHNKYENSTFKDVDKDTYFEKLVDLLLNQKQYRNPLLNIDLLSKQILISSSRLSQIINQKSGKNFNDLVNFYKIEDAKKLLESEANDKNILQIAYEVGFNSKSTFNTAFKKVTSLTPSQYRKKFFPK